MREWKRTWTFSRLQNRDIRLMVAISACRDNPSILLSMNSVAVA